jgi:hypothetical protein
MRYLTDTRSAAEQKQIEAMRRMSVGRRMALMRGLTASTHSRAMRALRRARPQLDDVELRIWFIELAYGPSLANKVRGFIRRTARNLDGNV